MKPLCSGCALGRVAGLVRVVPWAALLSLQMQLEIVIFHPAHLTRRKRLNVLIAVRNLHFYHKKNSYPAHLHYSSFMFPLTAAPLTLVLEALRILNTVACVLIKPSK